MLDAGRMGVGVRSGLAVLLVGVGVVAFPAAIFAGERSSERDRTGANGFESTSETMEVFPDRVRNELNEQRRVALPTEVTPAMIAEQIAGSEIGQALQEDRVSVLVHFERTLSRNAKGRNDVKSFAAQFQGKVKHEYGTVLPNVINIRGLPKDQVEALKRMPGVTRVEMDEYHPNLVRLHDATPLVRGLQSQIIGAGLSANGSGVRVCVGDTGIDTDHIMYASRIDASAGWDFYNNDSNPEDDHGHGTHVAGIAVGGSLSVDFGCGAGSQVFQGMAPAATLIGAKILNASGGGFDSDIIAGIDHCADQSPSGGRADVINLSIGTGNFASGACTHSWAVAANNAVANGVVVVAASGNENNSNSMGSPACGVSVIAVGATYKADYPTCEDNITNWNWGSCVDNSPNQDQVVCFSNESDFLDVSAPGSNIWSASNAAGGSSIVGQSGTSMASPMVAGLAALILDADPTLTPAEVRQVLRDGAIDLGAAGFDRGYGWGRIDAINSLSLLAPCTGDPDCDDGLWCNGSETCSGGSCFSGTDPCPGQSCNELTDSCEAAPQLEYSFDMSTNPGWTTQGQWAYGQPTGGGGQHGGPDPTSGATGPNVYGYNLAGDYANNLAEQNLTSTAIDCTGLSSVTMRFKRWLGVEQPLYDHAYVRVSNNGSSWTTVWSNGAEVADASWTAQEFDISAVADNQSTVYLRWVMGTTDSSWQYCGWNIDDVEIWALGGGGGCSTDPECDDGLWCNGAETCNGGTCQSGTAPNCNDGVGCTNDSCNEATDSCDNVANNGNCDDGLWCNGSETCSVLFDCQAGSSPNCNDGVGCTDDSCNEGTDSCDNVVNNGNCDDGLWCNGSETCHATLDCQAGSAPNCSDGVGCTDDSCNEGTDSCDNIANNGNCDDGVFCNGAETCHATLDCQSGGDPCPGQICDEGGDVCTDCQVNGDCDDGVYCNGAETCNAGTCQAGPAVNCNDGVGCTDDSCNEATDSCDNLTNNGICDDGLWCNGFETCHATLDCQAGSAPNCNDGVGCTDDSCNETTDSCDNVANNANCDDSLWCNGTETCHATLDCQSGSAPNCNDGVGCTDDSCNETTDSCNNVANDSNCPDDGSFCNGSEYCDAVADCSSTGDPCPGGTTCNETTDACDAGGGCVVNGDCDDGSACTTDICTGGVCSNDCAGAVSSFPYSENFESGLGAWSNVGGDIFNWTRDSGGTPSSNTGPSVDHTTGTASGFYMYIETSSPRVQGDFAIFEGPCLDLTGSSTADLSFWYHMYGSAIGTLDVEVSDDCSSWTNVWSLSGNQGNTWFQANVNLDAFAGSVVRVRFVGTRGSSWAGDIAIDDISVDASGMPCSSDPECDDSDLCTNDACVGSVCQNTPISCDDGNDCTVDTCSSGVCSNDCPVSVGSFPDVEDFSSGFGDWSNVTGDNINWTRNSGGTPSSGTGPSGDHTTGSGWYLYIEASSPNYPSMTAIVEGPCVDLVGATSGSVSFWYHMNGAAMGSLHVDATDDCSNWTTLWSLSGNQGNSWQQATVDLSAYTGSSVTLRFRGVTGSSYTSDICIDDIEIDAVIASCATDPDCDDANPCTDDACVASVCQYTNNSDSCDDGLFCTEGDACSGGACVSGSGDPCPGTFCNEATDTCDAVECLVDGDCDDGSACTTDTCVGGVCFNDCAVNVSSFPYTEAFTSGFGAWANVTGDDFNWTRDANGTPSNNTGPSGDHTTGSGWYMYTETSSPRQPGDTAILEGPCFDLNGAGSATFSFWYHMYGSAIGTLDVEVTTDCVTWTNVWTLSGNQGNTWFNANVDLSAYAGSIVTVRFIGTRGSSWAGDIAIDDVSLTTP